MKDGFVKTAAGTPDIKVADCGYNCARIKALIDKAHEQGVRVLVLPELCITGYTCQDLFFQQTLLDGALNALKDITEHSAGLDMLIAVGCPLRFRGELYNCAVVMKDGKILGVVPKKFLPNYNEFYEKRHFTAAPEGEYDIELFGESVPFGLGLLFECRGTPELVFAAEICEDLWAAEPPSISLALGGATLIANLSASNETIGKDSYRRELVNSQSARLLCGYVYASAGSGESTQDLVFGGHDIIAENGIVLAESKLYSTGLTVTEIDVQKLASERRRNTSFVGGLRPGMRRIPFDMEIKPAELTRIVRRTPFVPNTSAETDKRCEDILTMQAHGLEKRVRHTNAKTLVIGISGGLDSSLVCAISAKLLGKKIRTFAIGMDTDAIDLKYARQTAEYLGSEHHEIIINRDMVINSLEEVIRLLGTWDITTIRASMGMYLLCKAIHEQTDVRVLLTGEISDELFGYKYTDYAPTADAFQQESQKRIRELYMYDVLRADRCISSNSIEARVPFGDLDFVRYVMAIDPEKKLNSYGKGKYLLRKAFEGDWLPPEILWREKAAFSDAVGHSMVDDIKEYAESLYTDEEFQLRRANYSAHCMPFTKESLFYREIFEKYYHDQSRTIVGFWMPNKAWPNCNVNDPSARVLANYGASGV